MTIPSYWLNLFSKETWQEFLDAGAAVTGFRERRWNMVQCIKLGDYLLCYVTGISRFIGILQAESEPYRSTSLIWSMDVFPCRVHVRLLSQLTFETALPIHQLSDTLSIFQNLKNPNAWSGHVRGSPVRWKNADGQAVVEAVEDASRHPVERSFSERRLGRRPSAVESPMGEVTVPDEGGDTGVEPQASVSDHTEIQWLLLKLGNDLGLDVWVARNDRHKSVDGQAFTELPRAKMSLPRQFDDATSRIIEHIDVLWLRHNAIVAAFEIESTTSIYSGLLRMSDLLAMQPNLNIPLYLVAPDERRSKVIEEVNRPTFTRLHPPLNTVCSYIAFSELRSKISEIQPYVKYMRDSVIAELAEPCHPEGT